MSMPPPIVPVSAESAAKAATLRRPEILAPVSTPAMLAAAMENGADAVYFGVQQFNARLRAENFRREDLPRVMAQLHERGMRGYVTLNVLVFTSELRELAETLIACSDAGVDAVLVQDLGVAWLANRLVPGLPVHASTQMTITSPESVRGVEQLGIAMERVVAAREMNRRELKKLCEGTDREVEVFVHGAICVAYSGQCLTSEALGGRSANRGECAQACRLPYDLLVDGQPHEVDGLKYLLSPKDLAAWEDIGDLMEIGIASLKIEGRLKSPEYVAATVQSYRAAIDTALTGATLHMEEPIRRKLEMTFSRGFTGGYLHETNHQAVVDGRFPKKRGLFIGRVVGTERGGVLVETTGPIKLGDGVVFDDGRPGEDEQGGRVYTMERDRQPVRAFDPLDEPSRAPVRLLLRFEQGRMDLYSITAGQLVWKTSDPALDADLRASYTVEQPAHRRPVDAKVEGRVGEPLRLTLRDGDGLTVTVDDTAPADAALKHPLAEPVLRDQLGRLGGTPFELAGLELALEGALMVPKSRLNDLRRRAVELLVDQRRRRGTDRPVVRAELAWTERAAGPVAPNPAKADLAVLCRTMEQLEAILAQGTISTIYTDFEDIRLHREARKLIPAGGPRFIAAGLRIVKPGEAPLIRKLLEAEPDAILVRNLASQVILQRERPDLPVLGDYPLNVANHLTARLLRDAGLESLVPSYDLNIEQLLDLLRLAPPEWFEVTIHQYMPMFHMEHCVFCRFLSTGTDFTNCGRPCETHAVALRDRMGYDHPVKADAGCRNTVFNAVAQSGSAYLDQLLAVGVRRFRVDLLREDARATAKVIAAYQPAVRGERDGSALWRELKASSKLGVTRGSLDHERD